MSELKSTLVIALLLANYIVSAILMCEVSNQRKTDRSLIVVSETLAGEINRNRNKLDRPEEICLNNH